MVSTSLWRTLSRMVDRTVDRVWSEAIELHPWTEGDAASEGTLDPAREIIRTRGVLMMPGAAVIGEGGTQANGADTRMLENKTWLSVTEDHMIDWRSWRRGDRIYLPERDDWYAIDHVGPSATGRPNVYLIRLQDDAVQ